MPRQEHYWTTLENRIKRNFPHRNEPKGESSKAKEQKKAAPAPTSTAVAEEEE